MDGVLSERRAHPRACGENRICIRSAAPWKGSSPRMRGKRRTRLVRLPPPRLIPAHAGKTARSRRRWSRWRAHPRACGENDTEIVARRLAPGSSPRMRGKTLLASLTLLKRWAHPRACGENEAAKSKVPCRVGSSPRMRGKQTGSDRRESRRGLIPAHAGKTPGQPGAV